MSCRTGVGHLFVGGEKWCEFRPDVIGGDRLGAVWSNHSVAFCGWIDAPSSMFAGGMMKGDGATDGRPWVRPIFCHR